MKLRLKETKFFTFFMLLFPLATVYFEVVFSLSTTGNFFKLSTVFMLLFSVAYGGIGYL